ncbi:response regulator transcription factor [Actinoplanes sp. LDG1-06]|uniref:Response regulator transcription factor n=1 Tax=Paractinoplanes ovalisporus TaxID=2810368 RepID=A0ABS2AU45_9ACTN|nr:MULTISPECIES: response regulator transcription factor [Actinoplanes]MBM2623387.1 response regulator transcription factor [Actinoplanes ovalisporus]
MPVEIAVMDPLPMFAEGVVHALATAHMAAEAPADLLGWANSRESAVVVMTVAAPHHWEPIHRLVAGGHRVVVLLDDENGPLGAHAVRAGARAVLSRAATGGTLLRTIEAVLDGQVLMPVAVAAGIAAATTGAAGGTLTTDQVSWLEALAAGGTVAQLAERVGYSERAMFRLLQDVYRRMGAANRLQAIMKAQQQGLLRTVDPSAAR